MLNQSEMKSIFWICLAFLFFLCLCGFLSRCCSFFHSSKTCVLINSFIGLLH